MKSFPSWLFDGATVVGDRKDGPRSWTVWTHEVIGRDADRRLVVVEQQHSVRVSRRGAITIRLVAEREEVRS